MRYQAITGKAAKHMREGAFWLRVEKYYLCNPERVTRLHKHASHRALRRDAVTVIEEGLHDYDGEAWVHDHVEAAVESGRERGVLSC